MATKKNLQSVETIEHYDRLIASQPQIERKGAANPYTSVNGNMFTMLSPPGIMALRLPDDERRKFIAKYKSGLFEAYGAVTKEYVAVPDALLRHKKVMTKYLAMSHEYAKTLKPKATKKGSAKTKK